MTASGAARGAEERSSRLTARTYTLTFVALVVLTSLSFALSYRHLGALEMPAAILIAIIKASLVGLFFMGLVEEPPSSRLAILSGLLFVVLMLSFAVADVLTRP